MSELEVSPKLKARLNAIAEAKETEQAVKEIVSQANIPNRDELSMMVEERVREEECTYLEAIMEFVEEYVIDISEVKKYLSPALISKLGAECAQLKLVKSDATVDLTQFFGD